MGDKTEAFVYDLVQSLNKLPGDATISLEGGTAGAAALSVYDNAGNILGYLFVDSGEWGDNDDGTVYL